MVIFLSQTESAPKLFFIEKRGTGNNIVNLQNILMKAQSGAETCSHVKLKHQQYNSCVIRYIWYTRID
jgi:hypothetical protein